MDAVHLQRALALARHPHGLAAEDVVGDVAVEYLVHESPVVTEGAEEREQHVAPLEQLEAAVLEVVYALQVVGRDVLVWRVRVPGHASAAKLVAVVSIAVERDVPDRAELLGAAERDGGTSNDTGAALGLRLSGGAESCRLRG